MISNEQMIKVHGSRLEEICLPQIKEAPQNLVIL